MDLRHHCQTVLFWYLANLFGSSSAIAYTSAGDSLVAQSPKIVLAAIQMVSENGNIEKNLETAQIYVDDAARQGAQIILLPELMSAGYIYDKLIWEGAEPLYGPTVDWMQKNSIRYSVYMVAGILEASGRHFFVTIAITNPRGELIGTVRKRTPCAFEALYTRGWRNSHVIQTELGKIGIGICWENHWGWHIEEMYDESVDLVLMPFSAPAGTESILMSAKKADEAKMAVKYAAQSYSNLLGVPVAMVNKCGQWETPLPLMFSCKANGSFPGMSTIIDSDGKVLEQLDNKSGIAVAQVTLDPSRKANCRPKRFGRAGVDHTFPLNSMNFASKIFGFFYSLNPSRAKKARAISSSPGREIAD